VQELYAKARKDLEQGGLDVDEILRLPNLIARESSASSGRHPRYNNNHKNARPDDTVRLRHIGDAPKFFHLD